MGNKNIISRKQLLLTLLYMREGSRYTLLQSQFNSDCYFKNHKHLCYIYFCHCVSTGNYYL